MGEQSDPTAEIKLEATADFAAGGVKLRAGFRTPEAEVLAGGLLQVEFFVENSGAKLFYLFQDNDRARLRPAYFTFTAAVEGRDVRLSDPAADAFDLGGLGTLVSIEPGASYQRPLLVNEFVRLEHVATALAPGETSCLRLQCQHTLQLANSQEQAVLQGAVSAEVDVTLAVRIRRDDAALATLSARLAAEIDADRAPPVSAVREQKIAQLAALRNPAALPYLRSLGKHHPDPVVQMYAQRALTLMGF